MIITFCNEKERNEIKECYPDAYDFIKTVNINFNNNIILFKTRNSFGKYNILTKKYQIQVFTNNINYL